MYTRVLNLVGFEIANGWSAKYSFKSQFETLNESTTAIFNSVL